MSSASTGVSSVSSPTRIAAAPSPPSRSSALVGRPVRVSEAITSVVPLPCNAALSAPAAERTEPLMSSAAAARSRRRAACTIVALVLST